MQPFFSEAEKARKARRTIADALDAFLATSVVPSKPGRIEIARLKLPTGKIVGIPYVNFEAGDTSRHVWLGTASKFRAREAGSSRYRVFDLSELDGAEVGIDGQVTTASGDILIAVEIVPATLGYCLTDIEQKIIDLVLEFTGKTSECHARLRDGVPSQYQDMVPDLRSLDFAKLAAVKLPALRDFAPAIQKQLGISPQKVADALRKAGMRVPRSRPRRRAP